MGKDLKGKPLPKNIRQRKDGRYEVRIMKDGLATSFASTNLAEVKAKCLEMKSSLENGMNPKYARVTLNEWFYEWFEVYKRPYIKETSVYPTKKLYEATFGRIGTKYIKSITNIDIQNIINTLLKQEGRGLKGVRNALATLSQCYECAIVNHIVNENPCRSVIIPPRPRSTPDFRYLTNNEQKVFLDECESSWYREMLYVMLYTGLRIGEVGGLMWKDVDFEKKCITINQALSCQYENGEKVMNLISLKTDSAYRTIPFLAKTGEMLKSQYEKQKELKEQLGRRYRSKNEYENLVFTTSMGSPVTRYNAQREINNIVKNINKREEIEAEREKRSPILFKNIYPHALRHTFCSKCYEADVDPKVVQKLMGHRHYSTTIDIYTHISKNFIDKEVIKMVDTFAQNEKEKERSEKPFPFLF